MHKVEEMDERIMEMDERIMDSLKVIQQAQEIIRKAIQWLTEDARRVKVEEKLGASFATSTSAFFSYRCIAMYRKNCRRVGQSLAFQCPEGSKYRRHCET
jgi:hypothetical protein